MKITATIITLNEERNIARAMESLRCCDQIVVLDSGSVDRTVELASNLGAKVVEDHWRGYANQKNRAAEHAEELVSRKAKIGLSNLILDPAWTFLRSYVLQQGFLDGLEGLTIAHMAAIYTFLKYAKARNMSPE